MYVSLNQYKLLKWLAMNWPAGAPEGYDLILLAAYAAYQTISMLVSVVVMPAINKTLGTMSAAVIHTAGKYGYA